jgi:hypothetical protein
MLQNRVRFGINIEIRLRIIINIKTHFEYN